MFDLTTPALLQADDRTALKVALLADLHIQGSGTIRDISPQADSQTRTWRLRISMNHPPEAMALGATVTVTLPDAQTSPLCWWLMRHHAYSFVRWRWPASVQSKSLSLPGSGQALAHQQLVIFFMLLVMAAGVLSDERLSCNEDPAFTIKTAVISARWPSADVNTTVQLLTDVLEQKVQELPSLDAVESETRAAGLSSDTIASALNTLMSGSVVTTLRDRNRLIDVVLRSNDTERQNTNTLEGLMLTNASGQKIPLRQVATLNWGVDDPVIWRRQRLSYITVQTDIAPGQRAEQVSQQLAPDVAALRASLPAGYGIEEGGVAAESDKGNGSVFALLPVTICAMLVLLMIQLQRFSGMLLALSMACPALSPRCCRRVDRWGLWRCWGLLRWRGSLSATR